MTSILSSLLGAVAVSTCILLWLYLKATKSLKHFSSIRDVEAYKSDCENKSEEALAEADRLASESKTLHGQIEQQKAKVSRYQKLLGNLKTAAELANRIQSDREKVKKIAGTLGDLERASRLNDYLRNQETAIEQKKLDLEEFREAIGEAQSASEIAAQVKYYENYLAQLKADVEAVEEAGQLQEFGFYRPRFDFDNSEAYKR